MQKKYLSGVMAAVCFSIALFMGGWGYQQTYPGFGLGVPRNVGVEHLLVPDTRPAKPNGLPIEAVQPVRDTQDQLSVRWLELTTWGGAVSSPKGDRAISAVFIYTSTTNA